MLTQGTCAAFTLLPLEIQDMIWGYTTYPRTISLVPEAYNYTEDTSAIPWYRVIHGSPRVVENPDPTCISSARFTIDDAQAQPHTALQVSRRSRRVIRLQGYRRWKIQNREGRVKLFYWHREVDVITFPENAQKTMEYGAPRVNYHYWLRLFALQYPKQARIATRVAILTSQCHLSTNMRPFWVCNYMGRFRSLGELIIVIDTETEREMVASLIEENEAHNRFGVWKLPEIITEALSQWKPWNKEQVGHEVRVPDVRVVENVDKVLSNQSLRITLRCNPCEYLGMGEL